MGCFAITNWLELSVTGQDIEKDLFLNIFETDVDIPDATTLLG